MDDWVPHAAIEGLARRVIVGDADALRNASLEAIRELAAATLVEIGEVSDGGFFEWIDPLDDAVNRVRELWIHADPNYWGFAVWISNTQRGDQSAMDCLPTDHANPEKR